MSNIATTVHRLPSAANSDNATLISANTRYLCQVNGHNAAAAVRYIKFYNKATAPTVGTDVPFLTLACAASTPFRFEFAAPVKFVTGLGYGMVTGAADNNTTAVTAADIVGFNVVYF